MGYCSDNSMDCIYRIPSQSLLQQGQRTVSIYVHGSAPRELYRTGDIKRLAGISLGLGIAPIAIDYMLLWMLFLRG